MKKKYIILSTLAALVINSFAIEKDTSTTNGQIFPNYQVSFLYPMGTNGYESKDMSVMYSLNIIGGVVGEVKGAEFGGLFNAVNGKMTGVQAAGFANAVLDTTIGLQMSGFSNTNMSYTKGCQLAGYGNVVMNNFDGLQASGFSNYVHGSVEGIQLAGFANATKDTLNGIQGSGFANYAKYSKGKTLQLAGFTNVLLDSLEGLQGAGFANVALGSTKGAQIAGFSNYAIGDIEGTQASGFANVTTGELKGLQIAGFLNVAKNVKGTQIAFMNIADSVEGVSIGFLSIVKKGYNHIELESNESFYANANLKLGTEKFYNIFSIGAKTEKKSLTWGWGYGAGSQIRLSNKMSLSIDLTAHQINEDEWLTKELNILGKLSPTLNYSFAKHLSVYAGPSINALVQSQNLITQNILPWKSSYNWGDNNTNIYIYPGFRGGIRF